ncbi:MAG: UDP-N-acetylmuramoyl-L-alanyl-D-glutamate--2,6-diaminopimelate ligase [Gammaproteobacteria bacterium]|nr:UDP-N-acetylmuramoyl-L-alanyl-D-glutamate--2,6-diaminopimelate ligase [Gammaproteobacteria bacterium]
MYARHILKLLSGDQNSNSDDDFIIRGISVDSREVGSGFVFVAIKGSQYDGHDFIPQAVERGASIVIYEKRKDLAYVKENFGKKVRFVGVDNPRLVLAELASEFFGQPAKKLKIIGITGTNGKTTTSFLIESILRENKLEPGIIGTIEYKIAGHILPATNTTPDAIKLQHLFSHMANHNLTHVIMEVSSHALDQSRTEGINFHTAIFTNLTQDHLDYHLTAENYFAAKAKLFTNLDNNNSSIINIDDHYGLRLREIVHSQVLTYAIDNPNAEIKAEDIRLGLDGTAFKVKTPQGIFDIKTKLIGRHNVYNLLASIGVGVLEKIDFYLIQQAIAKFESVPGRLEYVISSKPFKVFVDYAHSEDALRNVLSTLRELKPKRILTVFGCGGNRDKQKRPLMGRVASELSDFLILTNDNPRNEQPEDIIADIKGGFATNFSNYKVISDRQQAIAEAISLAKSGDFVLIAGKGHEQYQIFNNKTIKFDDRKVAKKILQGK